MSHSHFFGKVFIDHRISLEKIPYINFPEITGRVLNFAGIPSGKQTISNPGVPEVIKKSKKYVKKAFIQQFFDDEGWPEPDQMKVGSAQCVDCTHQLNKDFINSINNKKVVYLKDIPSMIKNKIKPPNLLIDIKEMLSTDFKIYSNIRLKRLFVYPKNITAGFELEIYRKEDIKKFSKKISFFSPNKKERLEFMINRNRHVPKNITLLIINGAMRLAKNKGYFLTHEVAKNLGFPQPPIRKRLRTLVKKGIFDKKKEKFFVNIRP